MDLSRLKTVNWPMCCNMQSDTFRFSAPNSENKETFNEALFATKYAPCSGSFTEPSTKVLHGNDAVRSEYQTTNKNFSLKY